MAPWYVPFIVAGVVFLIFAVVFKLFKADWAHTLIIPFALSALSLVLLRKIEPRDCNYEMDVFSVVESSYFVLALAFAISLMIIDGCKSNPRRQCFACCRMKKEIGDSYYEERTYENDSVGGDRVLA